MNRYAVILGALSWGLLARAEAPETGCPSGERGELYEAVLSQGIFNVSGAEYFARTSAYTEFPEAINSPEFKSALREQGLEAASRLLEAGKILFVRYKGFSFGAVREPGPRLLAYFPGSPEKYVLMRTEIDRVTETLVSDVAVLAVRTTSEGRKSSYFREAHVAPREWSYPPDLNAQHSSPGDCTSCHTSGPLALRGVIDPRDEGTASVLNALIASSTSDYGDFTDYQGLGPGHGSGAPERDRLRTPRFIQLCSEGAVTDPVLAARVRDSMSCANCHDGTTRGALTELNSQLLDKYVLEGHMPPENDLSEIERQALAKCLRWEYRNPFAAEDGRTHPSLLQGWIEEGACGPGAGP